MAIRETQDQQLQLADPSEHARARARLLQAVDRVQARPTVVAAPRRSTWRWGLGGLAAAACAFAILVALPERGPPILDGDAPEVRIGDAELSARSPVITDDQPRVIAVSDNTRLELAAHGRLFVDEIRSNGATIVLEHGEVALDVHHEQDTSWRVAAGPWTVHVTGTRFLVAWEPSTEHFRVAVSEGSVRVEGPQDEVARLGAGEELIRGTLAPETLGEPNQV